jgi:hypothetical protein
MVAVVTVVAVVAVVPPSRQQSRVEGDVLVDHAIGREVALDDLAAGRPVEPRDLREARHHVVDGFAQQPRDTVFDDLGC